MSPLIGPLKQQEELSSEEEEEGVQRQFSSHFQRSDSSNETVAKLCSISAET